METFRPGRAFPGNDKVKRKTSADPLRATRTGAFQSSQLPPEIVGLTVDKVGKSSYKPSGPGLWCI